MLPLKRGLLFPPTVDGNQSRQLTTRQCAESGDLGIFSPKWDLHKIPPPRTQRTLQKRRRKDFKSQKE